MENKINVRLNKRLIKIIGGGVVGMEIAYICAKNGYRVHLFNKVQDEQTYILKESPFDTMMKEELELLGSPTYLLAKRMGVDLNKIENSFVEFVRSSLTEFSNVSYIESEINELNKNDLTLIATGNNTTKGLINDLSKYLGERKIQYFHPEEIVLSNVNIQKLKHDKDHSYHVNVSKDEYDEICQKISEFAKNYDTSNIFGQQISAESLVMNDALRTAVMRPIIDESKPFASLKLREENGEYYVNNFFTALSDDEQKEIISKIYALSDATIKGYGKIYKKTFLTSLSSLNQFFQIKDFENFFIGGSFLGIGGIYENLLIANYIAYNLMNMSEGRALQEFPKNTCTGKIIEYLRQKSALNHRLLYLNYDIICYEDSLALSPNAVLNFKEKFYGKYF